MSNKMFAGYSLIIYDFFSVITCLHMRDIAHIYRHIKYVSNLCSNVHKAREYTKKDICIR